MTSMQCIICRLDEGEMNLVGEKGLKTLLMAGSKKKESELTQTLKEHQNHQLMLLSPGKLVVFYALSQSFEIKKKFTKSKHCHCTATLLNAQKRGMMIGVKQYFHDWEHQMILSQKR